MSTYLRMKEENWGRK